MKSIYQSAFARSVVIGIHPLAVGCALLLTAWGCKTTSQAPPFTVAAVPGFGAEEALTLGQVEGEALYLKKLAVETETGIVVTKETLHSIAGLIECRAASGATAKEHPARCDLRVRFAAPSLAEGTTLSATQPMDPTLANHIATYAAGLRSDLDLTKTPHILANSVCDYIGKKSPPFTVESVTCKVQHPRLPTEAIFDGRVAEELSELARGATVFGTDVASVTGALQCRLISGSDRPVCMVRPGVGATLSGRVNEVSAAHSSVAARLLFEAAGDRAQVGAGASEQVSPRDAAGMLSCTVDSRALTKGGERKAVCRAAL